MTSRVLLIDELEIGIDLDQSRLLARFQHWLESVTFGKKAFYIHLAVIKKGGNLISFQYRLLYLTRIILLPSD